MPRFLQPIPHAPQNLKFHSFAPVSFEEYLTGKKIDAAAFRLAEPDWYAALEREFVHLHPNSFTAQKLYLINPLRRKYWLKPVKIETTAPEPESKTVRPVMRPKTKTT
ncbi:MAG: hypothetical protein MUC38_09250 [Cyclobacteriaceae bacterium]|jgi:hypothetical protein|nr:hypothetical protein [Cyclobacteriaceae bacterium]